MDGWMGGWYQLTFQYMPCLPNFLFRLDGLSSSNKDVLFPSAHFSSRFDSPLFSMCQHFAPIWFLPGFPRRPRFSIITNATQFDFVPLPPPASFNVPMSIISALTDHYFPAILVSVWSVFFLLLSVTVYKMNVLLVIPWTCLKSISRAVSMFTWWATILLPFLRPDPRSPWNLIEFWPLGTE